MLKGKNGSLSDWPPGSILSNADLCLNLLDADARNDDVLLTWLRLWSRCWLSSAGGAESEEALRLSSVLRDSNVGRVALLAH